MIERILILENRAITIKNEYWAETVQNRSRYHRLFNLYQNIIKRKNHLYERLVGVNS